MVVLVDLAKLRKRIYIAVDLDVMDSNDDDD